jgi:hypothetical protein
MIHRNALRWLGIAVVVVALAGLAPPATAQDIPKGKVIHIFMEGDRITPEKPSDPYRVKKVLPISKGICRNPPKPREDCLEEVSWQLKGVDLPKGWYIEVRLKQNPNLKKCFAKAPFALRNNDPVPSGTIDATACDRFDVWPYDIVVLNEKGEEKGREDPLLVINY